MQKRYEILLHFLYFTNISLFSLCLVFQQWLSTEVISLDVSSDIEARTSLIDYSKRVLDPKHADTISKIDVISVLQGKELKFQRSDSYTPTSKTELIQLDSEEIANQLTIMHANTLTKISKRELLNYVWGKSDTSPNVDSLKEKNDILTRWVITTLLESATVKEQASCYKKFYRLAKRLYEMRNYNGCSLILDGLLDVSIQSLQELKEVSFIRIYLLIIFY